MCVPFSCIKKSISSVYSFVGWAATTATKIRKQQITIYTQIKYGEKDKKRTKQNEQNIMVKWKKNFKKTSKKHDDDDDDDDEGEKVEVALAMTTEEVDEVEVNEEERKTPNNLYSLVIALHLRNSNVEQETERLMFTYLVQKCEKQRAILFRIS